jgi:HSP20 family molecular chaperone IbpA
MLRGSGKSNEEMWKLAQRMNQLMEDWMHARFRGGVDETWEPAIDIIECDAKLQIVADLAGLKVDEIALDWTARSLTLSGTRTLPPLDQQMQVHQMEVARGVFRRKVNLPAHVDSATAKVSYRAGILTIVVAKDK